MKPRPPFRARTRFDSTGIIIIDALRTTEMQTAKHLHHEIDHFRDPNGNAFVQYFKTPKKQSLIGLLNQIHTAALQGFKPILHFEGHGDKEGGLEIGDARESIDWHELGGNLRAINIACRNNLGVVLAACHGFHQLDSIDILTPCPYNFLIGPTEEIEAGFIDDHMKLVYRELWSSRDLARALSCLSNQFGQFQAELFFCTVFAGYIRHNCMGKGAAQRAENLLSKATGDGIVPNYQRRKELRRMFKTLIRKPEVHYRRLSHRFLHGTTSVPFAEVDNYARRYE